MCKNCSNPNCPNPYLKNMGCVMDCLDFEEYYKSDKRLEILQEINDSLQSGCSRLGYKDIKSTKL